MFVNMHPPEGKSWMEPMSAHNAKNKTDDDAFTTTWKSMTQKNVHKQNVNMKNAMTVAQK